MVRDWRGQAGGDLLFVGRRGLSFSVLEPIRPPIIPFVVEQIVVELMMTDFEFGQGIAPHPGRDAVQRHTHFHADDANFFMTFPGDHVEPYSGLDVVQDVVKLSQTSGKYRRVFEVDAYVGHIGNVAVTRGDVYFEIPFFLIDQPFQVAMGRGRGSFAPGLFVASESPCDSDRGIAEM